MKAAPTPRTHNTLEVPIDSFVGSPFQYRRQFSEEEMVGLVASVKEHGILQPVLLRDVLDGRGRYVRTEMVYGHRRWEAARRAGFKTIPANKRILDDIQAAQLALEENMQRENPSDWDTALGIRNLMAVAAEAGKALTEAAVARRINKSVTFVRNHLGLFKLAAPLQEVAQRHDAIKSSLFEIQKVANTDHLEALIAAIDNGASYKAIKAQVERIEADEEVRRESAKAPDSETQSRASENARTGGGNMSRGRQVTGARALDARAECERGIGLLRAWMPHLTEPQKKKVLAELAKLGGGA